MRLSRVLPAVAFFLIICAAIGYRMGIFDHFFHPIVVAVIDTGVDTRIPAISSRLSKEPGYNFFDSNNDVTDTNGHGTKVALLVAQSCGDCLLLPIKVSRNGGGVRPQDLAGAIRYGLSKGARVFNVSFGLTEGGPDVEAALAEARAKNAVLVAGAGTGIANPFRPSELSAVYPQAYPDVIVVGSAKSLDDTDMLMNYGDLLDVVVTGQTPETFGSSFAAGTVSGYVAAKLAKRPKYDAEAVRAMLRATSTTSSELPAGPGLGATLSRIGFGAFSPDAFMEASVEPVAYRVYRESTWGAQIELSASSNIESLTADVDCKSGQPAQPKIRALALKKGRGRVVIENSSPETLLKDCVAKIHLNHPGGVARVVEVTL